MMPVSERRLAATRNERSSAFPLFSNYYRTYRTVIASTSAMREECFRIRYDAYCVERQFEDPKLRPDHLEYDAYDGHSAHALLIDCASDSAIGTVRLILNKPGSSGSSLPFYDLCKNPVSYDSRFSETSSLAELSRFAISKSRSQLAFAARDATVNPIEIGAGSCLALGLIRMTLEMAVLHGAEQVCAAMEPSLLRMLSRYGIHFRKMGPLVSYHGSRQPCYAHVATLIDRIGAERPDIWEVITDCGRIDPGAPIDEHDLISTASLGAISNPVEDHAFSIGAMRDAANSSTPFLARLVG